MHYPPGGGVSRNGGLRAVAAVGVLFAALALSGTLAARVALAQTTHWVDASVVAPSAPGTACGANAGYATIAAALAAAGNGDTINVCPGVYSEANLVVGVNVRIQGQTGDPLDVLINAGAAGRIFSINIGVEALVTSLSMTGGASSEGGAILNAGTLELDNVIVRGNTSTGTGGGIQNSSSGNLTVRGSLVSANEAGTSGGGIFSIGSLVVNGSTLLSNHASVSGGGIFLMATATEDDSELGGNQAQFGAGSGIFLGDGAALTLTNSRIRDNLPSQNGGGIFTNGTVTMSNTIIKGNQSIAGGGGISISSAGVLTVEASAITENQAGTSGGGIFNEGSTTVLRSAIFGNVAQVSGGGIFTGRGVILANSTVSRNEAVFGAGSGLFTGSEASVVVINSTISSNASGLVRPAVFNNGTLTLANTIIADQMTAGGDCGGPGDFVSDGHNLDSDGSCQLSQPSDIPAGAANLGLLQDNGGPTLTHALLPGSMAIDAGNNAICGAAPIGGVDQRGQPRPGANTTVCDIGAFEVQQDPPEATPTPSPAIGPPAPPHTNQSGVIGAIVAAIGRARPEQPSAPPAPTLPGVTPPSTGDAGLSSDRRTFGPRT